MIMWLKFQGLAVCETTTASKPTLPQQIVKYLRNESPHGFHLHMPDGNNISLKGVLLLVAIAHLYEIRIVVFSTRRKPVEIIPSTSRVCNTIALLWHWDSILSIGAWYPLGPAQNWIKQTPKIYTNPIAAMDSPPAVKREQGAASKRKARANYNSISDDILKDSLKAVT